MRSYPPAHPVHSAMHQAVHTKAEHGLIIDLRATSQAPPHQTFLAPPLALHLCARKDEPHRGFGSVAAHACAQWWRDEALSNRQSPQALAASERDREDAQDAGSDPQQYFLICTQGHHHRQGAGQARQAAAPDPDLPLSGPPAGWSCTRSPAPWFHPIGGPPPRDGRTAADSGRG